MTYYLINSSINQSVSQWPHFPSEESIRVKGGISIGTYLPVWLDLCINNVLLSVAFCPITSGS